MQRILPKDVPSRVIAARARSILVYKLKAENWEWHEQTGTDHGTDIIIELVENEEFLNKKIEGQIKGTKSVTKLTNGKISFNLEVKTINYALNSSNAFVLFLVDVTNEEIYYLPLQDYFIKHEELMKKTLKNQTTISLHLDPENTLDKKADELCNLAKNTYVRTSSNQCKRIIQT